MAQETGLNPEAVKKIRAALDRIQDRTHPVKANEIRAGLMGHSEQGQALNAEMQTAVKRINSTTQNVWQASLDLDEAVTAAEKAVKNADEVSAGFANNLATAVGLMSRDFFRAKAKDERVHFDLSLMPGLSAALNQVAAQGGFEHGTSGAR